MLHTQINGNSAEDVVTIGLYSTQQPNPPYYHESFLAQKENVRKIVQKLTEAAQNAGKNPPKFVLSLLLVPNWKKEKNSFEDEQYIQAMQNFMTAARSQFDGINIEVQNFYNSGNLTQDEKSYMHQLSAGGSNADIIKTRAVINNKGKKHLQLDSNTLINDFDALYAETFNAEQQIDKLNAVHYRKLPAGHLDAHNKIFYATPEGILAKD